MLLHFLMLLFPRRISAKNLPVSSQSTERCLDISMNFAFILITLCQAVLCSAWPSLHFTNNKTFHITIFEDLHFGEGPDTDWGPSHDARTLVSCKASWRSSLQS